MSQKYKNAPVVSGLTRFSAAPMSEIEFSKMSSVHSNVLTMNAGDIVPIYCGEVLPHDTFEQFVEFTIRQSTLMKPTMGKMECDVYAFFVPNRIINESWKDVMGENNTGMWTAPVGQSLAPLLRSTYTDPVQIPVMSVADYYGFPTQAPIPAALLQQCNDLKFRGYLCIFNEFFRDQNYQPPLPFSKLNVYEGFLEALDVNIPLDANTDLGAPIPVPLDRLKGPGLAVVKAVYGDGPSQLSGTPCFLSRKNKWNALQRPLKANKRHDYFTSVLPSPQKGASVTFSLAEKSVPVDFDTYDNTGTISAFPSGFPLTGKFSRPVSTGDDIVVGISRDGGNNGELGAVSSGTTGTGIKTITGLNLNGFVDLSEVTALDLATLRDGAAIQQVYETLARGGTRYREYVNSFFGLEVDDAFKDIPTYLGHIRRDLELYQTAQTSESGSTPQGNLAGFGFTQNGGQLYKPYTFKEHGYVHIFAVVRHRNIYSSYFSPDNFRLNMLDFYTPQLANISEQPVRTAYINPFLSDTSKVFGYNEAWSEYRFEPNRVSGLMRPGVQGSLAVWNYADDFDVSLTNADGSFMKSNSQSVLDRTLAVSSALEPQFIAEFTFKTVKQRPMPTYSVPGLDIV